MRTSVLTTRSTFFLSYFSRRSVLAARGGRRGAPPCLPASVLQPCRYPRCAADPTIRLGMTESGTIFESRVDFDPAGDFEAFLRQAPAKWAVYLLTDADGRPVQLLCVKNLRYSLKRRLGPSDENATPSKRVDYRDFVRQVYWRRVDSAFEADWVYYEAARRVFPRTYQGMVGFRPAWFVHVNPEARFPRYTKTTDLTIKSGLLIGPVEDKHAAARLMQLAEDSFDLCRYYQVLVEAPHGRACAYKEMGKCPAPCDGSISMEQYRRLVGWSA